MILVGIEEILTLFEGFANEFLCREINKEVKKQI